MRRGSSALHTIAAGLLTLLVAAPVAAFRGSDDGIDVLRMSPPRSSPEHLERTTVETLWIFDADFEDLSGDNAGWTTYDRSGTRGEVNYWHKDTIRINGFTHLGDSTWWCGTYSNCWRQPRGYGNDWTCVLAREFPEVATNTAPGDVLTLEYDQRYAIEKDYDYGYVDASTDGGDSWTTVHTVTNPGFVGTPGISQDWDSIALENPGHMVIDLSDYAGTILGIRFRFESD
ncbi:MAG: immune inhibitor A, partial [Candidatus Eisenbacteria sp.]|nr:immune inhibitor A [Candidatus Eisenbacteria bacterium]